VGDSGKYVPVDQSKGMEDMGGSGNWRVKKIEFRELNRNMSASGRRKAKSPLRLN